MKQPINTSLRLFDLVRFMRSELHEAELISDEEYGWLCYGSDMAVSPKGGSPSRARLEEYDEMRAELAALRTAGDALATALGKFLAARGVAAVPSELLQSWTESAQAPLAAWRALNPDRTDDCPQPKGVACLWPDCQLIGCDGKETK